MWIGNAKINDWGAEQREFLLNRNTVYRIHDVSYDSSSGKFIVELYYIGREKHKYK